MAKRHRIRKRPRAFAARGARSRKLASLRPGAMRKKGFRCIQSPAQNFRIRWFLAMGRALFCRRVGIVAVRIPLYRRDRVSNRAIVGEARRCGVHPRHARGQGLPNSDSRDPNADRQPFEPKQDRTKLAASASAAAMSESSEERPVRLTSFLKAPSYSCFHSSGTENLSGSTIPRAPASLRTRLQSSPPSISTVVA